MCISNLVFILIFCYFLYLIIKLLKSLIDYFKRNM